MPQIKDNGADVISRYCPIKLYFWDITESAEQLLGMLPSSYGYHEAVAARFRSETRSKEWLAVRVLLHRVADISEPIAYKESGGPYFVHTPLSVSISHTSHFACLALGNVAFGVDIEQYGAKALVLTDKFLKPQEKELVSQTSIAPEQFAVLAWSAKEAVYKAADDVSLGLFQDITIEHVDEPKALLSVRVQHQSGCGDGEVWKVSYVFMPHFVLTLCFKDGERIVRESL